MDLALHRVEAEIGVTNSILENTLLWVKCCHQHNMVQRTQRKETPPRVANFTAVHTSFQQTAAPSTAATNNPWRRRGLLPPLHLKKAQMRS